MPACSRPKLLQNEASSNVNNKLFQSCFTLKIIQTEYLALCQKPPQYLRNIRSKVEHDDYIYNINANVTHENTINFKPVAEQSFS